MCDILDNSIATHYIAPSCLSVFIEPQQGAVTDVYVHAKILTGKPVTRE